MFELHLKGENLPRKLGRSGQENNRFKGLDPHPFRTASPTCISPIPAPPYGRARKAAPAAESLRQTA